MVVHQRWKKTSFLYHCVLYLCGNSTGYTEVIFHPFSCWFCGSGSV